ncbi:sirohydrochlorin chelatase [Corynebacterium alimapuense]|uniref:Sirohydrochlorin chelatase n=1 Tax=Corynebacterium alimapuense TaxID=1576874 RepID=A0A3M8K9Q3_9CORY|nr:sirohydrochlorin chelatase [Corynebacterium alimapuense]RNE49957.1 hypothetical protein C5L39_00850 [Corynebacterium alimapuense]
MTALITLSHGSRHALAGKGIERLAKFVAAQIGEPALAAHLDFESPSLSEAAVRLDAAGATRAVVVPLLFTSAFHARHDVPAALAQARETSGIELLAAESVGTGTDMVDMLSERVNHEAPQGAHIVLYSVGSSDQAANAAVAELAARVGVATGHSAESVVATGGAGTGPAGVIEVALKHRAIHLLPLFFTRSLLLDKLTERLQDIASATGTTMTASGPLGTVVADIVAARYHVAVNSSPSHLGGSET